MSEHAPSDIKNRLLIPTSLKNAGFQVILMYLLVFLFTLLALIPFSKQNAEALSDQALVKIENYFEQTIDDLSYLLEGEYQHYTCNELLIHLRKSVFRADTIKEIGVFDANGRMFCTSNNGDISFYLYSTIQERVKQSQYNTTLSYTTTKLAKEKSVALLFKKDLQGNGLSVLIPPRYIISLVDELLAYHHLEHKVRVITRELGNTQMPREQLLSMSLSEKFPLKVEVYPRSDYLFHYLLTKSWIGFFIASLVTIFVIFRRNKRLSNHALPMSLEAALKNRHLEVYFQPIVDQRSWGMTGCEALLRWNDPVQGMISPGIFIPLAEKVGLIENVTNYVISQTCLFLKDNYDSFEGKYISVNISRSVILKTSFVNTVASIFKGHSEFAQRVVFEITENNDFTEEELLVLRTHVAIISKLGIRFAVDDFGTGYSGLNFIRQCPFDFLKIDRVFVKNLNEDSNLISVLKSMQQLADDLDIEVIVEGVEENEQLRILDSLGFHYIQGFYFSKPLPRQDFMQYIQTEHQQAEPEEVYS